MAITPRNSAWGGASLQTSELLQSYITSKIDQLEPDLQYTKLGTRKDAPKGWDRIAFPQYSQIGVNNTVQGSTVGGPLFTSVRAACAWGAGTSVITGDGSAPVVSNAGVGVVAIIEGTNPTATTWGATTFSTGPAQYGVLVTITDLLVRNSAIETIDAASEQVRRALARMVDTVLQIVVNAGSNGVIYSGAATSRAGLGAGDLISTSDVLRAITWMRSSNAAGVSPYSGNYYAAVIAPEVATDLMQNTATGSWSDFVRYQSVDDMQKGALGNYRGARFLETGWQFYFNSTTLVRATTFLGQDSFGWGYFQTPQAILTTTPDSNNPLNLYSSIGGKVTVGATRFNDQPGYVRIVRVESAFTQN